MQTDLSDYIDIKPILMEEEVIEFIRKAKIEIK